MTIEELNELRFLITEEKRLLEKIAKTQYFVNSPKAVCAVVGNDRERVRQYQTATRELEEVLRGRLCKVSARARELKNFLDQIKDPIIHELLELHCVKGHTWEKITVVMQKRGLFYSASGLSKKCSRYLSKGNDG